MLFSTLLLVLGLGLLWGGSELLVRSSSKLALSMGVRPILVGLTVVAMGTSSPELAVSLTAALQDTKGISLGNIIGSNIANIGLVVGACALIRPLQIQRSTLRNEVPIMVLAILLFSFMCWDGIITFLDGLVLFIFFIFFLIIIWKLAHKDRQKAKDWSIEKLYQGKLLLDIIFIIFGLGALIGGAVLIVESAVVIAEALGVSEAVIAISMVAVGTSLPELAISAVGSARKESDLAVGNAVGSNIFNTLFVIAVVAMVTPIPVSRELFSFQFPAMIFFTLIAVPMMWTRFRMARWEGLLLLILYGVFIALLF